jgi:hypothetical protein
MASYKTLEFQSIETCPTKSGEATGPFVLAPDAEGYLCIGHHDGRDFRDDCTEEVIEPECWAYRPSLKEIKRGS